MQKITVEKNWTEGGYSPGLSNASSSPQAREQLFNTSAAKSPVFRISGDTDLSSDNNTDPQTHELPSGIPRTQVWSPLPQKVTVIIISSCKIPRLGYKIIIQI